MRLVIIESPYSGDVRRHKAYLQACILDSLRRGESPYASHQMLTEALDDSIPEERKLGMNAVHPWRAAAHATAVYADRGLSGGMAWGVSGARALQYRQYRDTRIEDLVLHNIEVRYLHGEWSDEDFFVPELEQYRDKQKQIMSAMGVPEVYHDEVGKLSLETAGHSDEHRLMLAWGQYAKDHAIGRRWTEQEMAAMAMSEGI